MLAANEYIRDGILASEVLQALLNGSSICYYEISFILFCFVIGFIFMLIDIWGWKKVDKCDGLVNSM